MAKEIKEHTLISSIFFEKTFKKIPFSDLLHYNILHKTVQFQNDGYKLVFNNEEKKTFDKNYILNLITKNPFTTLYIEILKIQFPNKFDSIIVEDISNRIKNFFKDINICFIQLPNDITGFCISSGNIYLSREYLDLLESNNNLDKIISCSCILIIIARLFCKIIIEIYREKIEKFPKNAFIPISKIKIEKDNYLNIYNYFDLKLFGEKNKNFNSINFNIGNLILQESSYIEIFSYGEFCKKYSDLIYQEFNQKNEHSMRFKVNGIEEDYNPNNLILNYENIDKSQIQIPKVNIETKSFKKKISKKKKKKKLEVISEDENEEEEEEESEEEEENEEEEEENEEEDEIEEEEEPSEEDEESYEESESESEEEESEEEEEEEEEDDDDEDEDDSSKKKKKKGKKGKKKKVKGKIDNKKEESKIEESKNEEKKDVVKSEENKEDSKIEKKLTETKNKTKSKTKKTKKKDNPIGKSKTFQKSIKPTIPKKK